MRIIIPYRHTMKRFGVGLLLATIISLGFSAAARAETVSFQAARQCDANAIISCGALTTGQLRDAYQNQPYVQKVYAYFGINHQDIASLASTSAAGHVDKNGNVYLDGRTAPVATNAVTAGRQNIPGSKAVNNQGASFYVRPLRAAVTGNTADAFIVMNKTGFDYAVIAGNGDPVVSTAAKPAPKKAATPTPTPPAPLTPQAQLVNTGPMSTGDLVLLVTSMAAATLAGYRYQLKKSAGKD